MRTEKPSATHESGRKDEAKDIARDGQLHAKSKQGYPDKGESEPADARRIGDRSKSKPD